MARCVINIIELEPYSSEVLILIKGYNYCEVVEWYKEMFAKTDEKNLAKIKTHYHWYNEHLTFFKDIEPDITKAYEAKTTVEGAYLSQELKSYPGTKIRVIVLKNTWEITNPHHMATLAHELLHLCQEFLPTFLNRDIEHEAEAYFHTYLMTRIFKLFE